ncbi:flavin-containing monooxygenase [Oceanicoccus sagamiensis]|uniref:flavin-containing monooxygenase n=1 Tax=Oceanicoccus sagamiensis TaxID=716816 RepID=UPI001F0A6CC1|nr:NAD(P)/FAD-dependent oxidoreductase [Oceanicoccus sagamiensis]
MTQAAVNIDVLIMGAGLSGIGSACHLQKHCPDKSYVILEARQAIGGTWDLFRYPGIRSDSDMFGYGYHFKPWTKAQSIVEGHDIKQYIEEAASEHGVDQHIRFGHKIKSVEWSDASARWTVTVDVAGEEQQFICKFFFSCGGYYNYEQGYTPDFEGIENYQGQVIHPQHWPSDLDYSGKRIVVIGSGATAVTLVPNLAKTAASVTMLQRSPSYIASLPAEDPLAKRLLQWLPTDWAYKLTRWKNILFSMATFSIAKKKPSLIKQRLSQQIREYLGPDYDIKKHFRPRYEPWDQRLCMVPDGDLFQAIRSGKAEVVTDTIKGFTHEGIALNSGESLSADIVVMATGLKMEVFSGVTMTVNGKTINTGDTFSYKGMMLSGVPNFAFAVGYTNAAWTLKSDLVGEYVCRLLNYMEQQGKHICVTDAPLVLRAMNRLWIFLLVM